MTARLYLAPDGYGAPTIWRETGHDRDEAVLTRTGGNAAGFDALAEAVAMRERVEAVATAVKRDANDDWTAHTEASDMGDIDAANRHGDLGEARDEIASRLRAALTDGATR